jgi:two-component system cell cycle sensor histidine kinase/response regulator CckA
MLPGTRMVHLILALTAAWLVLLRLSPFPSITLAGSPDPTPHPTPSVLILDSYHQGYDWTDRELVGLLEGFRHAGLDASLSIEHLDMKRFPDEEHQRRMVAFLADKYHDQRIDLIVILDNPAFDLVRQHRDDPLFSAPIVFLGINNFDTRLLEGWHNITGVAEATDFRGTLSLALTLHPGTRQVLALHDYTATGLAIRQAMEALVPTFRDQVQVHFNEPATWGEVATQIAELPPDSLVLILGFITDREGLTLTPGEGTALLTARARVPVYSAYEAGLGYGIVGGFLLGGEQHGRQAAAIALRVLAGEDPASIPVEVRGTSGPMFDYRQLERFHVPLSALPAGSIVVNRPVSFYEQNRTLVWATASVLAVLTALVIALAWMLVRQRRAREALRESEGRFRQLAEAIREAFWIVSPDWKRVDYISPAYEEIWGRSCDSLRQRPLSWLDAVVDKDREAVVAELERKAKGDLGGPGFPEYRIIRPDGSERWIAARAYPIRNERAELVAIAGVAEDITGRKEAEADHERLQAQLLQSQKMEATGRLTAGIAHDFNNMLTAILGFAELMQLQLFPDDPLREMVDRILSSGRSAANLVQQLMAFSRQQLLQPKIVSLNDTIGGMEEMLRRMIGEHVALEVVHANELWPVEVDVSRFQQVIVNLAVNARDAMPQGGRLLIKTANDTLDQAYAAAHLGVSAGDYVQVIVSDTGCGMPPEVKARIFEPFFTTKPTGKGTGLGLATAYGIVQQSGGHISFDSTEGKGTTFIVHLPRAQGGECVSTASPAQAEVLRGKETILLVEDNAQVRDYTRQVLQLQGYTIVEAEDGEAALRVSDDRLGRIDLLLTDVVMPGLSGKMLARQLLAVHPRLRVLYMSGYSDDMMTSYEALEPGTAFIQKPFGASDLTRAVRRVLDSAQAT